MTSAVVYMRCSGKGQIDGDTWERQIEAINSYASKNEIVIDSEYRDQGVSGKTELDGREGLSLCLAHAKQNSINLLLVESADRLARDAMVAEVIIREAQKMGIRVISASGGVDLTEGSDANPTAKLVRQVLAAVAEFDRCVTVLKLRGARQRHKVEHGRCEGRKPYGANEDERPTLDWMQRMRAEGMTYLQIAQSLNFVDKRARNGGEWRAATVGKILIRFVPGQQITSQLQKHDVQVVENVELSPAL